MKKCKCEEADPHQENFAGFRTDNNHRVIQTSKVMWRKSHRIHLNELCRKLGIKLHLREDGLYVLIVKADEEVEMMFENSPLRLIGRPQAEPSAWQNTVQ